MIEAQAEVSAADGYSLYCRLCQSYLVNVNLDKSGGSVQKWNLTSTRLIVEHLGDAEKILTEHVQHFHQVKEAKIKTPYAKME